jgi:hypothetical protein
MTLTYYKDYQELFAGAVAYWDGSLTSDGKLQDIIGGYHGTINGATKNVVNRFEMLNSGIYFNSQESDYIALPNVALTQCPTTCMCWVRHPTILNANPGEINVWPICCFVYGSSDIQIGFRMGDGSTYNKIAIRKWLQPNEVLLEASKQINIDDYYFVAGRYNANHTMDLFINNEKFSSSNTQPAYTGNTQSNCFGSTTWPPYYKTNFYFSEFLLYKGTAVSDEIILEFYNISRNKYLYPVQSGNRAVE